MSSRKRAHESDDANSYGALLNLQDLERCLGGPAPHGFVRGRITSLDDMPDTATTSIDLECGLERVLTVIFDGEFVHELRPRLSREMVVRLSMRGAQVERLTRLEEIGGPRVALNYTDGVSMRDEFYSSRNLTSWSTKGTFVDCLLCFTAAERCSRT